VLSCFVTAKVDGGSIGKTPSDAPDGFDKTELVVVIAASPNLKSRTTLAGGGKLRAFISESELDVEAH